MSFLESVPAEPYALSLHDALPIWPVCWRTVKARWRARYFLTYLPERRAPPSRIRKMATTTPRRPASRPPPPGPRSEERRVGKECRSRRATYARRKRDNSAAMQDDE